MGLLFYDRPNVGASSFLCRSEDDDLKLAMQLSKSLMENSEVVQGSELQTRRNTDVVIDQSNIISEEDEIQKAIAMSLEG